MPRISEYIMDSNDKQIPNIYNYRLNIYQNDSDNTGTMLKPIKLKNRCLIYLHKRKMYQNALNAHDRRRTMDSI